MWQPQAEAHVDMTMTGGLFGRFTFQIPLDMVGRHRVGGHVVRALRRMVCRLMLIQLFCRKILIEEGTRCRVHKRF